MPPINSYSHWKPHRIHMQNTNKCVESLYKRYAYLAEVYSYKIFNLHKMSYDREDVVQDLSIKLLQAIKAYGHRWAQFKRTGRYKPVPINIYLRKCMQNMVIDLGKRTTRQVSIVNTDQYGLDYGRECTDTLDSTVCLKSKQMVINGIDMLEGLGLVEKGCFMLFTRGFPLSKLNKLYAKHFNAEEMITTHLTKLRDKWYLGKDSRGNNLYSGELFSNITPATFVSYTSGGGD